MSASGASAWRRKLDELFGIDPRTLAVFRVALGATLLFDLLWMRAPRFAALYADTGVMPRRLLTGGVEESLFPLHMAGGSLEWQLLLTVLLGAAALLLLVGLRTRLASFACWFLLASLQVRNPFVLNFGDELLRHLLFWGMFLPLGRVGSLDARRAPPELDRRAAVLSPGSLGLLLQVFLLYLCTGLLKNGHDWWSEASAVWYTVNADWWARPLGVAMRQSPELLELATRATLALELIGPFLLFSPIATRPLRVLTLLAFAAFQLGLAAALQLGIFPLVNLVALLPFLPGRVWDPFSKRSRARWPRPAAGAPDRAGVGARLLGRVGQVLAAIALLYMVAYNANGVRPLVPLPDWATLAGYQLRLNQKWAMYSPNVPRADGWFVFVGQLANGRQMDLSDRGPELRWGRTENLASTHSSFRWARYLWQLRSKETNRILRARLAWWLCRDWNARHADDESLVSVQIHFVSEETAPVGSYPVVERRFLLRHDCRDPREP